MDRPQKEPRKSSLPSSLIPHLYTGPVDPRDSSARSTLAGTPTLPAIVVPGAEAREHPAPQEHAYTPPSTSPSFRLTPVVPLPPPEIPQAPAFDLPRSPQRYFAFDTRTQELPPRGHAVGPSEISGGGPVPLPAPLAPIHDQPYAGPVYSDPLFHTSRLVHSMPPQLANYTFPAPTLREPLLQRASWGEGENDPSSMFRSVPREPPLSFDHSAWREGEAGPSTLLHPIPREPTILRASWREDEASPPTMAHPATREQGSSRGRRGSSQPAPPRRFASQPDMFIRGASRPEVGSEFYFQHGEVAEHGAEVEGFMSAGTFPSHPEQYGLQPPGPYLPAPPSMLESEASYSRHEPYIFPPTGEVSALSLSSAPGTRIRQSSELPPSSTDTGEKNGAPAKRKRRKASPDPGRPPRRGHPPRKTAVACNFCRGRKLRCNGARPTCSNCVARKFECEYVPIQRRRGPGKAPKRSRSKKGSASAAGTPDPSSGPHRTGDDPRSPTVADYEWEALAPELRPYASVMSLERFSFQPPESSPLYPGPSSSGRSTLRRAPETPQQSQYTSSEEGSGEEDMDREMS